MPVRGAIVRRRAWFRAVELELRGRGFTRCESNSGFVAPGFYFYGRAGYRVQIASGKTIRIWRPDGRMTEEQLPDLSRVRFVLDALELNIEFPD